MPLQQVSVSPYGLKILPRSNLSLSTYYPLGTQFYYGYPAGEDSGFLNSVTPPTEELVAARPFTCAGAGVSVVCFASTLPTEQNVDLYHSLNIPLLSSKQTIILPEIINTELTGKSRNIAVRKALLENIEPKKFVMAQPYTEPKLSKLYQIPPATSAWLNDKANMGEYIDESMLPKRYGIYHDGEEFFRVYKDLKAPVVIKASSSSSGDGVYLCMTQEEIAKAANNLREVTGNILAEQYIRIQKNYGLHFGIPHDKKLPIDIFGINEQVVSPEGQFMGGFIESTIVPEELNNAVTHLLESVLPKVRDKGWYGIGGFDVLVDDEGGSYFIDCNFRMTGMSAYHFLVANDLIKAPLLSFAAEFNGTQEEFEAAILPLAGSESEDSFVQLITLSENEKTWRFNGALTFNTSEELQERATAILQKGITSGSLKAFAHRKFSD